MAKSGNTVRIDGNGFIHNVYSGDQTVEGISGIMNQAGPMTEQLRQSGKPILVLVDLNDVGHETAATRKAVMEGMKSAAMPDRVAIFGKSPIARYSTNFVAYLSGKANITRFFKTEVEAVAFLKEFQNR